MNHAETVKRSKIYTYFYGRNTVFQQFLIIVGVFLIVISQLIIPAVAQESAREQYYELEAEYDAAYDAYYDYYNRYKYSINVEYKEPATIYPNDPYEEEKETYNELLDAYNEASDARYDTSTGFADFLTGVLMVIGIPSVIAGIGWILFKKLSFNRDGERDYDQELDYLVAEAKKKGLEKLNIISDQIERVEPVVLHGIARTEGNVVTKARISLLSRFGNIFRLILVFDKIILGSIAAAILGLLTAVLSLNMIILTFLLLVELGGLGALGFLIFKKFEQESFVSPRVIKRLTKFSPKLLAKLGSDDKVRVSLPAITVYMFGDDQLYVYYQYVDIVTGRIFCEGVNEYFYEDIVGVTSTQETKKIFKRCGFMKLFLKSIDYLKESITVITSGCVHQETYIVDMGKSLLDTQFIGMRNLIRQKKAEK